MRINIRTLFELTAFISLLLTLGKVLPYGFGAVVFLVHIGALAGPIGLAFWSLITAPERDMRLDVKNAGITALMLRFSLYCLLTVCVFWLLLTFGWVTVIVYKLLGTIFSSAWLHVTAIGG